MREDTCVFPYPSGTSTILPKLPPFSISAWASAAHFGDGAIGAESLAANLVGAVVKDPVQDTVALQEYLESVVRTRDGWSDLYSAIREVL